eukprot:scaffold12167_cov129-Cylindrotheca_fusiformis.AAC.3
MLVVANTTNDVPNRAVAECDWTTSKLQSKPTDSRVLTECTVMQRLQHVPRLVSMLHGDDDINRRRFWSDTYSSSESLGHEDRSFVSRDHYSISVGLRHSFLSTGNARNQLAGTRKELIHKKHGISDQQSSQMIYLYLHGDK